ncbi:testis-specific serine/threonine-protein kinase 1 [Salmo salar]|uniref:non-specific serine/threonine protein kinase n=1 Tax=Salmo salar TaxID=8030 RepID=A0A1S3LS73_SALSA|nr:testis-specific serine/threonine-protein kinase 1-like [Salmo salar]|eukprot:XP_013993833.1 PREDICTED: testis-specific serine/threonine-protein kinase 1-like [Salmo salar]
MDDSLVLKKRGYTLGISLGEGSYAKVKSAYSERLKTNVAIKIINRKKAPPDFLEKFLPRELDILASLNHRNIVKTFEIFETSEGKVYMIMELGVQGDLLEFIKFRGALPEDFTRKLFKQLSLAIKFAHALDVVHRDLKCENLLLDQDFNLKVSDFGFARRIKYDEDGQMILSKTFCGSAAYASPEVLQGVPYNPKVYDVWSMGVVLFIMLCGSMPYDDSNIKKMLKIQKEHRIDFPRSKAVPTEYKDLIYRMLNPDVAQRVEIDDILEHVWVQSKSHDGSTRGEDGPSTSEAACSKKERKGESSKNESKHPHGNENKKGVKAEAEAKSEPKPSVESKEAAGTSKHTKKKLFPDARNNIPADS